MIHSLILGMVWEWDTEAFMVLHLVLEVADGPLA
ncbi:hypothetical protein L950_0202455 [Sphingobacterium sp. IITKGP-BTPF85]|nr:hypothetical protein L950_0202455 [Sphingobacterium sp. IITKGP-BTPF85]